MVQVQMKISRMTKKNRMRKLKKNRKSRKESRRKGKMTIIMERNVRMELTMTIFSLAIKLKIERKGKLKAKRRKYGKEE